MSKLTTPSFALFERIIAATGGSFVFDGETSVSGFGVLFEVIRDMGLDPMKTADLKSALYSLFNIEFVNMPDLSAGRLILTPNHVSDLDAVILGLLHPRIRIVSKNAWADNEKLRRFLDLHYDLYGLDRTSLQSLRALLTDAVRFLSDSAENRHYLVFSQGTISDFNNNSPERISSVARKISDRTGVPVVPMFIEQVSFDQPTRIVFGEPMSFSREDDFRVIWLDKLKELQDSLDPPARRPKLTEKHSNNNKPGDQFF
jgi:1-acyl-sn-glycerol-3-phosphate acyltransferase